MRIICCLLIFYSQFILADCYGSISLPLSMDGKQNQLQWNGSIGGKGIGSAHSSCISSGGDKYDFRYNIIETIASCTNTITNKTYYAPVSTTGASVAQGAMSKLSNLSSGNSKFEAWGRLSWSPAVKLPVTTSHTGGIYNTMATIDISSIPAGDYSCRVRNIHGAYGSNSNDITKGLSSVFNFALTSGRWATGYVNVKINASCVIPDSININHGAIAAGTSSIKSNTFKISCNRDTLVEMKLLGGINNNGSVIVNVGRDSKSILSLSQEKDNKKNNVLKINVGSNIASNVYLFSTLLAKGYGTQTGYAVIQVNYS